MATSHTYFSTGDIASTTFPRSLVHNYTNYSRGTPQNETQPQGVSIVRTVSPAGNVTSERNGEGFTTSYSYDGLNRVTGITYPQGNPVSIAYTATTKTATRGSLVETSTFSPFGHLVAVTLGGIARTYTVDALGRRVFESNPASTLGTTYAYDTLNRLTTVTNADNTSRTVSYGAASKTITDERSNATTYRYRAYGDPDRMFVMAVDAPVSSVSTTIQRNSRDLMTSISQGGFARTFGYDSRDYLSSEVHPETGTTVYGRDDAGNMTSRSVGGSATTIFEYDGQSRLFRAIYPGVSPATTYAYSRIHRITSAAGPGATRSYGYDANGNLTSETITVDIGSAVATYGFNGNDQLSSMTTPMGTVVNYSPDVLGRPTQVSGFVNSVAYWPSGQINQIVYANGVISLYGQNSRLWPSSMVTQRTGFAPQNNASYIYDGVGNLTNISDIADSAYSRSLGYDAVNRLTSANGNWGGGGYTYGQANNIATQTIGVSSLTYFYDGSNRLASTSGFLNTSLGYDTHGAISAVGASSRVHDGAQNLVCVNCGNPTTQVQYAYDGNNQRAWALRNGVKTYEMYDARGNLILEYVASNPIRTVEYIYLGGKRIAQRTTP